ncbi:hypothetical protein PR202_gb05647 [Eleusine coracana subsp. coracana]|uniref:FBD domain-containing protein n=1 Tax=Eleusine coracana subsp. coracana TaxID=191504 RepID=A0AAV5E8G2_ELECO|nr:hypothetical protein PR202_gb05647 [Eleusine coracana subsp. coracana]
MSSPASPSATPRAPPSSLPAGSASGAPPPSSSATPDLLLASSDDEPTRAAAAATIGRILADHPGPFRAVHLTSFSFASRERELAEWTRLLAAKGVQDLVLVNDGSIRSPSSELRLPADILSCATLQRLLLENWRFPDTSGAPRGADIFPRLKELGMFNTGMSDHDLEHMIACSPEMETLSLVFSTRPELIRLRSQSLLCMLLWASTAEELAVVDAPCLERLILWRTSGGANSSVIRLKIARAPELRVLGYLEPRVHQLQIGSIVINAATKARPSSTVPSVKILALRVNFGVLKEVDMLASFLRCFPNVETLHIESAIVDEATGRHHARFWREAHHIECVKSHVTKIVIHELHGDQSEFEFLKFIAKHAQKLQALLLMVTKEIFGSVDEINKVNCKLQTCCSCTWANRKCIGLLLGPKPENRWSFLKA